MRNPFSAVSDPNNFVTCAGNAIREVFKPKVLGDGTITLRVDHTEDTDMIIQAFLPQTDISVIIAKLQRGDTSGLTDKTPMYGDFTNMPSTMADAFNLVLGAQQEFDKLPVEVKQKYGNSFVRFFGDLQSGAAVPSVGFVPKVDTPTVESSKEVKD